MDHSDVDDDEREEQGGADGIERKKAAVEARSLRGQLDHLLERFRADAIVEEGAGASALAQEVRTAIEEEFVALVSHCDQSTLRRAVLMPFDDSRRLPVHLACDKNAPLAVLRALLDADAEKRSIVVPDKWGDLPLHTACSRHQTEVVELLVDADASKRSLFTKADNGSLPLHAAVRYCAPASVVMLLLETEESRRTLQEPDFYGQLPLHAACRNGAHPDVINLLLKYDEDKKTPLQEDKVGRLPVHLALLHTTERQLEVVKLLLTGMLCGLMERKGLDLWKMDMKSLLKSMESHERDFTTRDKLDMICEDIRAFMERVFVLELAVWRASCLKFDATYSTMDEVLDHESSVAEDAFDAHYYKVDRRIRSGVDVIVRDVIPFVEDEPVEGLLGYDFVPVLDGSVFEAEAVIIDIAEEHFFWHAHREDDASVSQILHGLSEDIAVPIDEYGLLRIWMPGFGHHSSEHRFWLLLNEIARYLEMPSADVELDGRRQRRHVEVLS
ncbi:hypothetical protein ACHAWF_014580 [Thalassiosira exigua]